MAQFTIQKKDGSNFDFDAQTIESNTLQIDGEQNFPIASKLIDNANLDGAIEVGERRIEKRTIKLSLNIANRDAESVEFTEYTLEHRIFLNTLLDAIFSADYLIDNALGLRIKVTPSSDSNISFLKGTYLKFGTMGIGFTCLEPFWQKLDERIESFALSQTKVNDINFTVGGYSVVKPILVFSGVYSGNLNISITDTEELRRINIATIRFENNLIIDCQKGTVTSNKVDILQDFSTESTFFDFMKGANNLEINILSSDTAIDFGLDIKYREGYYI